MGLFLSSGALSIFYYKIGQDSAASTPSRYTVDVETNV